MPAILPVKIPLATLCMHALICKTTMRTAAPVETIARLASVLLVNAITLTLNAVPEPLQE